MITPDKNKATMEVTTGRRHYLFALDMNIFNNGSYTEIVKHVIMEHTMRALMHFEKSRNEEEQERMRVRMELLGLAARDPNISRLLKERNLI